ncbi:Uncharacterised protein [Escherichia coli]|jgi:hypothetical protein|nr:Uncharacterised protein [Escherichia coli]
MIVNSCEVFFDGIPAGYVAYAEDSGFSEDVMSRISIRYDG